MRRRRAGEHVPEAGRIVDIDNLGYADDRIVFVTVKFGYMDTPDVPALLPLLDRAQVMGARINI